MDSLTWYIATTMSEWTSDQYVVDEYSPMHRAQPMLVTNYENQYAAEQQRLPAYNTCRRCANRDMYPAPRAPMRKQSVDMRSNALAPRPPARPLGPHIGTLTIAREDIDAMILFFFLVIVIRWCCLTRTVWALQAQLQDTLRLSRKKE